VKLRALPLFFSGPLALSELTQAVTLTSTGALPSSAARPVRYALRAVQEQGEARRGDDDVVGMRSEGLLLYPLTSHALVVEDTGNNSSHLGRPSGLSSLSGICGPIISYHLGSWTLAYAKGAPSRLKRLVFGYSEKRQHPVHTRTRPFLGGSL
jgi:hypothetical protein